MSRPNPDPGRPAEPQQKRPPAVVQKPDRPAPAPPPPTKETRTAEGGHPTPRPAPPPPPTPPVPAVPAAAAPPTRRGFMTHFFAATIGLIVSAVPFVSGLLFFLDPLFRQRKKGKGDEFLKMPITLDALEIQGKPQLVKIAMDRVDAWSTYRNQPVGAAYLRRIDKDTVVAFNQRCPHLGCPVDYRPTYDDYFCSCHTSNYELSGEKINDIPPRGLDALDVQIRNQTEVWVKFQHFRGGTPEKIPVS